MDERFERLFKELFRGEKGLKGSMRDNGIDWEELIDARENDEGVKEKWRKWELVRNEKAREQGAWCRSEIAKAMGEAMGRGDFKKASVMANSFLSSVEMEIKESEKGVGNGIELSNGGEYGEKEAMENLGKIQEIAIKGKKLGEALKVEKLKMQATKVLNNDKTSEVVHRVDLGGLARFIESRREAMPVIEGEIIKELPNGTK